jgi:hypothetical protein
VNKILCTIATVVVLVGCARTGVTLVGDRRYSPLPSSCDVRVFGSESEVKQPFEVVAIISYTNPGKYQILTLDDAIPELKEKARTVGANAVIIDQTSPVKSGFISTGMSVRARAVALKY